MHSPLLISIKKLRYVKKVMVSFHTTYYGFYRAYKAHGISNLLPYYYPATKLEHHFLKQLSHNKNVIITAVSPSVAEELSRNGLALSPHVIPNGLEMPYYRTLDKHHAQAVLQQKYSLKLSEKDRLLLYVGRITEQKQPFLLVDLFKRISSIDSNIHLVIVGSGNLLKKLRKKAILLPNLHILGRISRERLTTLLSVSDAFVSLSCYEGLPLAVLEAASFNLPLILSDIPAHRWIINSGIAYGALLNSSDPNLAEILSFIESGIGAKKALNELSVKYYTWDNIVSHYLTLLYA